MVQYCVVPTCKNNALIPGVSFHLFPRDSTLRKMWLVKIRRDERTNAPISHSMRVCSEHFLDSDYREIREGRRKYLKKDAIPSVFSFNSVFPRQNILRHGFKHESEMPCVEQMSSSVLSDVKGVLLDITGVLYESGQKQAIPKSVEAIRRLKAKDIPFRFVTNETQRTRKSLVEKLNALGFEIYENEVFSPGLAASLFVKKENLRPFLLVHPDIMAEFEDCDPSSPNCVVVGDAAEHFSYENMNKAFKILISSEKPILISMGKGRFYKEKDELVMDLGGFTAALEYAAGVEAKVIGKPSPDFFLDALRDMAVAPQEAAMVGDDMNSDVHAAQKCGMKGIMVKTGKFRKVDLEHPVVKPDLFVRNLAHFVDLLCNS